MARSRCACAGHLLRHAALARSAGGGVERADRREYGFAELKTSPHGLFKDVDATTDVWMSHGDHVAEAPEGWTVIASQTTVQSRP